MFEARFQTYWADSDPAGIVFFPHFFRFVEQAEEELFRAAGEERHDLLVENHVWIPRVEAFAKFSKPIRQGEAVRVQLNPQMQGSKTIRYDFVVVHDGTGESLAAGYVTVVCVDAANFKSTPLPDRIRKIIEKSL
jgi:YbgC/YbaW family acyl-CoA thioester hydrolase